jgi:hypothetical protein
MAVPRCRRHMATILRIAPTTGGEKAVPENIPRMPMCGYATPRSTSPSCPRPVHDAPKWQAMEALRLVAEHNGPTMFARSDNRGQTTFPLFNRAAATKKMRSVPIFPGRIFQRNHKLRRKGRGALYVVILSRTLSGVMSSGYEGVGFAANVAMWNEPSYSRHHPRFAHHRL